MLTRKRSAALLLALALSLQLAACGASGAKESTATEVIETTGEAAETTAGTAETNAEAAETTAEKSEAADGFIYEELGDGSLRLTGYTGTEAEVCIPSMIDGKPVTVIGESCFAGSLTAISVEVPEGVTAIEDYAFECCSYLRKVYLPDSLISIGSGAFSGCVDLTMVDIQDQVETIGNGAFMHCVSLVYFEAPANLKELGEFAFNWCRSLTTVNFRGDDITEIKERTFGDCIKLASVTLPGQLNKIGEYAFFQCEKLAAIYIPDSVTVIGSSAFNSCTALESISISCEVLAEKTFFGCSSLDYLDLGDKLKRIEANCISETKLERIWLPDSVEEIDPAAFASCDLSQVYFNDNDYYVQVDESIYTADMKELVTYFVSDPFADEAETSFTVPDGVEKLGDYAFERSKLTTVILPDSVKEIGAHTFKDSEICELTAPEDLEIPESAIEHCYGLGYEETYTRDDEEEAAEADMNLPSLEEVVESYEDSASYRFVKLDEFRTWADEYIAYNSDAVVPDPFHNHFIAMYKIEVPSHYYGMTGVKNQDPDMLAGAAFRFGEGFEDLYLMMDHGLETEINRFVIQDSMVVFSGVYDSQLKAAAGTDYVPTIDELKACVGNTFTDPIMISTTTEPKIACHFGSTLFIIYADKDQINELGAVCIDSYMEATEYELLMNQGATYEILDAGTMRVLVDDGEDNQYWTERDYVSLKLLN